MNILIGGCLYSTHFLCNAGPESRVLDLKYSHFVYDFPT